MIIWITGLAGAGISTIGRHIYELWKKEDPATVLVDGDVVRNFLRFNANEEAYTREARYETARRYCDICAWMDEQRLCLARTLANQPEIILMDEPCSAIDPMATQHIEELIGTLKRDYTIIVVTHNLHQAKRISEQAIFMFAGRIIESGTTERLFAAPQTKLARDFCFGLIG